MRRPLIQKALLFSVSSLLAFFLGIWAGRSGFFLSPQDKIQMAQHVLWDYLGEEYGGKWQKYFRDVPKWYGLPMLQMPFDVLYQQELIYQSKAKFVIETGTFKGGSALFFASVLDGLSPDGLVLTIDIKDISVAHPKEFALLSQSPLYKKRIRFFHGSSVDPGVVSEIKRIVGAAPVLVTLDSDHEGEHVYQELKAYAPLVHVGGYIIVQDTKVDDRMQKVEQQPYVAIERFLRENPNFEIDRTRRPFLLSKYLDGVLRRTR